MNFFVNKDQIHSNKIDIIGTDVNHIKNVLRKEIGNPLVIVSGEKVYLTQITSLQSDVIECEIIKERSVDSFQHGPEITIFQGLTKADKMEYIIQKCSELGAKAIVPIKLNRCVVKLDEKDEQKKLERWQKIAEAAAKQCGRLDILEVKKIRSYTEVAERLYMKRYDFDLFIVAYEGEKKTTLKSVLKDVKPDAKIAVLIGPEGGLEPDEVKMFKDKGAKVVTLGNRILRTETAPVVICSNIMYELDS